MLLASTQGRANTHFTRCALTAGEPYRAALRLDGLAPQRCDRRCVCSCALAGHASCGTDGARGDAEAESNDEADVGLVGAGCVAKRKVRECGDMRWGSVWEDSASRFKISAPRFVHVA